MQKKWRVKVDLGIGSLLLQVFLFLLFRGHMHCTVHVLKLLITDLTLLPVQSNVNDTFVSVPRRDRPRAIKTCLCAFVHEPGQSPSNDATGFLSARSRPLNDGTAWCLEYKGAWLLFFAKNADLVLYTTTPFYCEENEIKE